MGPIFKAEYKEKEGDRHQTHRVGVIMVDPGSKGHPDRALILHKRELMWVLMEELRWVSWD